MASFDDDDFFDDDIAFDDSFLASIAAVENKFLSTQAPKPKEQPIQVPIFKPGPSIVQLPPSKRVKSNYQTVAPKLPPVDEQANPEVFIEEDGRYARGGGNGRSNTPSTTKTFSRTTSATNVHHKPQPARPVQRQLSQTRLSQSNINGSRTSNPPRPLSRSNSLQSSQMQGRGGAGSSMGGLRPSQVLAALHADSPPPLVSTMRAELEKLRKEKEVDQTALREANEARMVKEGEAATLRRKMETSARVHAEELERLKGEKRVAEEKQAEAERSAATEMERLKSRMVFKQHELETSARKTKWPTNRAGPSKPAPTPLREGSSPIRESHRAGTSHEHPVVLGDKGKVKGSDPPRPGFNTFINSFGPSSPVKSPRKKPPMPQPISTQQQGKGKERQRPTQAQAQADDDVFFSSPTTTRIRGAGAGAGAGTRAGPSVGMPPPWTEEDLGRDQEPDMELDSQATGDEYVGLGEDQQEVEVEMEMEVVQVDIGDQLQRIILTHTSPRQQQPTLQLMLSVSFPEHTEAHVVKSYRDACPLLLSTVGMLSNIPTEEVYLAVAKPLIVITRTLRTLPDPKPLISALELLCTLSTLQPHFAGAFLSFSFSSSGASSSPSALLSILCEIVAEKLKPPPPVPAERVIAGLGTSKRIVPGGVEVGRVKAVGSSVGVDKATDQVKVQEEDKLVDNMLEELAKVVLELVDRLAWPAPEEYVEQLSLFIRRPNVLSNLLDVHQPAWVRYRTMKTMSLIATHCQLFRQFLSFPEGPGVVVPTQADYTRIPLVETLCQFLREPGESITSIPVHLAFQSIIVIFSLVAIRHEDATTILIASHSLIPSLVICLGKISVALYEDDREMMMKLDSVPHVVKTMQHITHLLHYLIFSSNPPPNVRQKILEASHHGFNGLHHMFLVTLGRMSYADPSPWIGTQSIEALERTVELSRDIMETVVEGPEEGDAVWEAYQGDDEEIQADEEEEAMRLGMDEFN